MSKDGYLGGYGPGGYGEPLTGLAAWLPEPGAPPPDWYLELGKVLEVTTPMVLALAEQGRMVACARGLKSWREARQMGLWSWRSFRVRRGQA